MNKPLLLVLALAIFVGSMTTYGESAKAFHGVNHGYFKGLSEGGGWWNVWPAFGGRAGCQGDGFAIPNWVDTKDEFIAFTLCKLGGSTQERIGAAFLISTMTGMPNINPSNPGPEVNEFVSRINYAASRAWITFNAVIPCNPGAPPRNTFYQSNRQDVAWYWGCPTNGSGAITTSAITFYNGSENYILMRYCSNPIGNMPQLQDPPQFNLSPSIELQVNGGPAPSGSFVEPGDLVTFRYQVTNSDSGASGLTNCSYRRATYTGYNTTAPATVFSPLGANCPPDRSFPGSATTLTAEEVNITANPPNSSICRSFTITPTTPSGGSSTQQSCVHVAAKPYFRAYTGDLAAGGGFKGVSGACTMNAGAAVIGWNKRALASVPVAERYGGAGVQNAIFAMSQIFDTAASLNAGVGPPTTLSFANNVPAQNNAASGLFGGYLGSVPCIADHYGTLPASYSSLGASTSAGLASGTYHRTGDLQLDAGSIAPGNKVSIFVNGRVYINGNITYCNGAEGGACAAWDSSNIPMFRLIVNGDIHVGSNVSRLDGLYVAQPTGATTAGIIYTCQALTQYTPLPLTGQLGSLCSTKLTVNGAFVARQVRLLRTIGTLRQSLPTETPASNNIAEVFNLNPAFWISQPDDPDSSTNRYDSITSLPPIL